MLRAHLERAEYKKGRVRGGHVPLRSFLCPRPLRVLGAAVAAEHFVLGLVAGLAAQRKGIAEAFAELRADLIVAQLAALRQLGKLIVELVARLLATLRREEDRQRRPDSDAEDHSPEKARAGLLPLVATVSFRHGPVSSLIPSACFSTFPYHTRGADARPARGYVGCSTPSTTWTRSSRASSSNGFCNTATLL